MTNGFTRLPHDLSEAIMLRDFTKRQRKILDLILRLSDGCNREPAIIPRHKDFEIVGIYEPDVGKEIEWLKNSKILTQTGQEYQINSNTDEWQVSRVKPFNPDRLSVLLRINLNGLSKTLSENLVKHEVLTSQNTKFATHKLGMDKKTLNKQKEKYLSTDKEKKNKFTTGAYADMVNQTHEQVEELYRVRRDGKGEKDKNKSAV